MKKWNLLLGAVLITGSVPTAAQNNPPSNPPSVPSVNSGVGGAQNNPPSNPPSVPTVNSGVGGSLVPTVPSAANATVPASTPQSTADTSAPVTAAKGSGDSGAPVPSVTAGVSANATTPDTKSALPTKPPLAAADGNTFVIGPQDVISVSVWKEPELSGPLPVRPDGMISLPLLHDVQAAGFTPMQLSADIATKLKKFVQDPQVSVVVTQVNSQRIFILGEVGHPGPLAMNPGMTALQAIASAGGLGPFANKKKIYLLRAQSGAPQEKILFKYKQALRGDDKQDIVLKPGDTIVVP